MKKKKAKDPARYPKIITPIEASMKSVFKKSTDNMVAELTKEMVDIKKK